MANSINRIAKFLFPLLLAIALAFNNLDDGWGAYFNPVVFLFISGILLFICGVLVLFTETIGRFRWGLLDISVLVFAAYIFLRELMNNGWVMPDQLLIGGGFILYYLTFRFLSSSILEASIANSIVVFGFIAAVYGICQSAQLLPSTNRMFPSVFTFSNPGPYAGFLMACTPFCLKRVLEPNTKGLRAILHWISLCTFGIALIVTQSRGAWLATIVTVAFLIIRWNRVEIRLNWRWMLIPVLIVMLSITLFQLRPKSVMGRILIWKISAQMWRDSPVLGIGPGQYSLHYNDFQANYFENHADEAEELLADNTYHAFNVFVEIMVELGILGLILFCLIVFLSLRYFSMDLNRMGLTSQATVIGVCVFGLVSYPFASFVIDLIFIACLGMISSRQISGWEWNSRPLILKGVLCLFCSTVAVISIYTMREKIVAVSRWREAYALISVDESEGLNRFRQVYPQLRNHGGFLFNFGAELSNANHHKEAIEILEQARINFNHSDLYIFLGDSYKGVELFGLAEAAYAHASNMVPSRLLPKYLLVKLFILEKKENEAIKLAKEIVMMQPKIPSNAAILIQSEMKGYLEGREKAK